MAIFNGYVKLPEGTLFTTQCFIPMSAWWPLLLKFSIFVMVWSSFLYGSVPNMLMLKSLMCQETPGHNFRWSSFFPVIKFRWMLMCFFRQSQAKSSFVRNISFSNLWLEIGGRPIPPKKSRTNPNAIVPHFCGSLKIQISSMKHPLYGKNQAFLMAEIPSCWWFGMGRLCF